MYCISELIKGVKAGVINTSPEGLFIKLFEHALSIYHLDKGVSLPELHIGTTYDFSSINILSRAAIESFLRFYYIFVDPVSEEELILRHHCWKLYAAKNQLKKYAPFAGDENHLNTVNKEIRTLKDEIKSNNCYRNSNLKRQKAILDGKYQGPQAREMAEMAGINLTMFDAQWSYTSGHAHGDAHNVKQIHVAINPGDRKELSVGGVGFTMIAMAYMIKGALGFYKLSDSVFSDALHIQEAVKLFVYLGTVAPE